MFDFFYYYGYGYFSYLIFMLPALVISLWAQISVKSTFHKYSGLRTGRGLTGAQAAQEVLRFHNVMGVRCERVAGQLTDHFDPRTNVIRLSDGVYGLSLIHIFGSDQTDYAGRQGAGNPDRRHLRSPDQGCDPHRQRPCDFVCLAAGNRGKPV